MPTDPFQTDPALVRAAGYPYDITAHSFTFVAGAEAPFDPRLTEGRKPVIGYGSNQSPLRLRQKYGTDHAPIPVQRGWLADHDVVFSAHFSNYGSLPAALRHVPGTRVAVAVNWLSDIELVVMHPTEIDNYHFAELIGLDLELDDCTRLEHAFAYLSFRGHVGEGNNPYALKEITAQDRKLPALSQPRCALTDARPAVAGGRSCRFCARPYQRCQFANRANHPFGKVSRARGSR